MPKSEVLQPLTHGQKRWLEHFRACEAQGCSLKDYALAHGLSVQAAYVAKGELKRRGAWPLAAAPSSALTLLPVSLPPSPQTERVVLRVSLANGTVVEIGRAHV